MVTTLAVPLAVAPRPLRPLARPVVAGPVVVVVVAVLAGALALAVVVIVVVVVAVAVVALLLGRSRMASIRLWLPRSPLRARLVSLLPGARRGPATVALRGLSRRRRP